MIPTINIFALLIMCFAAHAVAQNENPVIRDKCNSLKSKSIQKKRHSETKCYVLVGHMTLRSAKTYCEQNVPEGMKGQLLVVRINPDPSYDQHGEFFFVGLTECPQINGLAEALWVKEWHVTSADPEPYKACELACTSKTKWHLAVRNEACSPTATRRFVCQYELATECIWSGWSSWPPCSVTCGKGTQSRTFKSMTNTNQCGQAEDNRTCDSKKVCDAEGGGIGLSIILVIVFGSIICVSAFAGVLALLVWHAKRRRAAAGDENTERTTSAASDYESPMKITAPVMIDTDPEEQQPKTELSQSLTVGAGPEKTLQSEELSRTEKHKPRRYPSSHSYSTERYFSLSRSKKHGTMTKSDKKKTISSGDPNIDSKKQGNMTILTKMTNPLKQQSHLDHKIAAEDRKASEIKKEVPDENKNESLNATDQDKQKFMPPENEEIVSDLSATVSEVVSDAHEEKQPDSGKNTHESSNVTDQEKPTTLTNENQEIDTKNKASATIETESDAHENKQPDSKDSPDT